MAGFGVCELGVGWKRAGRLGEWFGGSEGWFCHFQFFVSLVIILLNVLGFWLNLNAFVDLLLNKRLHEPLKHNSPI